ncbi:hypothetical protein E2542_SST03310 [Spatholobus suberectus]|nr:hypothetical protein E2542_SST03310 [Spatholobus suberectus]
MAHLFRDLSLGHSKRETTPPPPPPIMPPKPPTAAVRRRRPPLSAGPTRREPLRFRPRPNRVRDLRRGVPHLLRQASEFRPEPLVQQFAESELAELARAPAIPHLHRRQQGQEGLRPKIARFGFQEEPWLRFRPGKAEAASHRRRTHAEPDEGFRSHGFARETRAAQDFRWPGWKKDRVCGGSARVVAAAQGFGFY